MANSEDVLDCILSVDEMLSEVEEALQEKKYDGAMHKLKAAREMIEELREDDEAIDDRQEVDMHIMRTLK